MTSCTKDILDMNLINKINTKYKFKIKQITDNKLHIDSGTDEWVLEIEPKAHSRHKNFVLWHKNHKRNLKRHHEHKRYWDYYWVFGAINNHEQRFFKKWNRMNRLINKINSVNLNKVT